MNVSPRWLRATTVVVVASVSLLVLPDAVSRIAYAVQSGQADAAEEQLASAHGLSAAFERVADVIRPSVVNISSIKRIEAQQPFRRPPSPFFNTPFRDFFGDDFFDRFSVPHSPGRGQVQKGLGTGVIVSDDGHIITNNHVVNDADEVTVKLSDDRTFTAKVVGTDPKTDLAVLKIDAKKLRPATLGDSDGVRIGEWVVAAGNPFGLTSSITAGIVSAKGRANIGVADYEDFIQTDAAINPGNSGGPLVNLRGEVVGINTAIFTKSGGYMGIGFAIPVNMAKSIMESLVRDGRVVRGWLGVLIQDLEKGLADSFGHDGTDGALASDVEPNSPADKAGFERGDIIVRFDGKEVTIGEFEASLAAQPGRDSAIDLGATLRNLTPEAAHQLGIEDNRGVLVLAIDPLGRAARAGIQQHDVIRAVQGEPVEDLSTFREIMSKHRKAAGVRLTIRRGPMRRYVYVPASK